MASNYERLFSLDGNQFLKQCPVLLCGGTILKHIIKGTLVTQLKFKNLDDKTIIALKVKLSYYNPAKEKIYEDEFDYLDLQVQRDTEFGSKTPIIIKNTAARSFTVLVKQVVFDDGTVWNNNEQFNDAINSPQLINDVFHEEKMLEKTKEIFGEKAIYLPNRYDGLWTCVCGEINKDNEKTCYCCGNKYEKVFSFDFTRLLDELELEKKQLIEDKKEEILTDEDNKKSKKPLILIVSSAVVLLIILALFISPKNNKSGDTVLTEIRIGDTVNFGWYEQDNNTGNGKEEIEWLVLDKEGKDILLMSYYALDCQQYNTINEDVTWETCSLRKWLNNDFLNTAFDTDQQSMIKDSLVKADAKIYGETCWGVYYLSKSG